MKIYAIDFGNANTTLAELDTGRRPLQIRRLEHNNLGFHYGDGLAELVPSCVHENAGDFLAGEPARAQPGHTANLKRKLRHGSEDAVQLCAAFFGKVFPAFALPFADPDACFVFTQPSFGDPAAAEEFQAQFKQALAPAIAGFDELLAAGRVLFCDEALASAVGYRVYQRHPVAGRDVLCLDVGSFSADATFFSTTDFEQVQQGQALEIRRRLAEVAGSTVDDWIEQEARQAAIEAAPELCEGVKLALSGPNGSAAGIDGIPPELGEIFGNRAVLSNLLRDREFFEQLAELCAEVLPERVRANPAEAKKLNLLFTGGTSCLPGFGREVHSALWQKLFGRETQSGERLRPSMTRSHRPFDACVTGALWWRWLRGGERYIPVLDRGCALKVFDRPDPADGLVTENIPFLAPGQDVSDGFQCSYKLVPAHPDQSRFRIDFVTLDGTTDLNGEPAPIGFVEGELQDRKAITLTLKLEPPDRLSTLIDGQPEAPVYLSGHQSS